MPYAPIGRRPRGGASQAVLDPQAFLS